MNMSTCLLIDGFQAPLPAAPPPSRWCVTSLCGAKPSTRRPSSRVSPRPPFSSQFSRCLRLKLRRTVPHVKCATTTSLCCTMRHIGTSNHHFTTPSGTSLRFTSSTPFLLLCHSLAFGCGCSSAHTCLTWRETLIAHVRKPDCLPQNMPPTAIFPPSSFLAMMNHDVFLFPLQ